MDLKGFPFSDLETYKESMDIEQKLHSLRAGVEKAKQNKLRAEMLAESAQKERDVALTSLREEFGVDSVESANQVLNDLRGELSRSLQEAESVLKEVS